jgi:putative endopeptidase
MKLLGVRNIDAWYAWYAWYAAFDVEESDDLYLPPEQRVSIW